jgi:hypothetical protein
VSVKQQLDETTCQEHVQMRLVLCNIKELFVECHEKQLAVSIGFSKYAELC